jgi:hypothetical protein
MKKHLLIIFIIPFFSVQSQNLDKEFLLRNFFDSVAVIGNNHFNIQLNIFSVNFDLIGNDFKIKSYINPYQTKSVTRPLEYNNSPVNRTPEVDEQVRVKDSTYLYSIVENKLSEFNSFAQKVGNTQEFTLYKQNEIINSLNHTKHHLGNSANFHLAAVFTSILGGTISAILLTNQSIDNNIGLGIGLGSSAISLGFSVAGITQKKKSADKQLKPVNF